MALSMPFTAAAPKARALRAWLNATTARWGQVTRVARARAGYAAGMVSSACGVGVLFGVGWALLAGGLACSWSFLHLYPVDEQ